MKVQKIQQYNTNFRSEAPQVKEKFTDKFSSRIKNSADLNDCVAVPRSVFKGYLAFMLGTGALTLGSFLPQKAKTTRNAVLIAGNLVNTYGIWSFVRPYIIKDATPTVKGSAKLDTEV